MGNLWKFIREVEWFAVFALVLIATALALVIFTSLWEVPVVLGLAAIVSAVFSHRT